jgi:hypothetical protein
MTAQIHEGLIFDGEAASMAFCPPLPTNHPRVISIDPEVAAREKDNYLLFSTGCRREYRGTWEIKDGQFWLVGLEGRFRLEGAQPLFAEWFTGVILVPRGELLVYVHGGFASVYEEEIHVRIERGRVVSKRTVDNRGAEHYR